MSGYCFDADILIDALLGRDPARSELRRATARGARAWISRVTWIEVMSRCAPDALHATEMFLSGFAVDEIDEEIAGRAATLRRERPGLAKPDAIVLASALVRGRVLVTRNTRDFPAAMPGIRIPYTL